MNEQNRIYADDIRDLLFQLSIMDEIMRVLLKKS